MLALTLPNLFDLSLISRRDQAALEWDRTYSFGEIDSRASRMTHALAARGVKQGDRVSVYLPNSLAYIDLFLAVTRLAAVFVPVNILYRHREIRHIVNDAEPFALITDFASRINVPCDGPIWTVEELLEEAARQPDSRLVHVTNGDAPAAIVYTSGTTGTSKGAVLSHNVFAVNALNIVTCWQITAADRLLLTLPLFHVHGLGNGIHCWLVSGCRMRLAERFEYQKIEAQMNDFKPTLFFGVPTMYVRLLDLKPESARAIGQGMRLFVSGSAPLAPQVLDEFRTLYGHTILERYGMSETLMNLSNPYAGERRPGSVGFPLPGVSTRIVNEQGEDVADGETGELLLRGANLFSGYWKRPDATAEAFSGGWFRTGDLAVRAPDGYFTLKGRRSDLIISGGFNIYPREIEELLLEQDSVAEVVVTGVPDARRGEVPVAYIVSKEGCTVDASTLDALCRRSLASFKIPKAFITVDRLPRTALGKVQKHLLPSVGDHR